MFKNLGDLYEAWGKGCLLYTSAESYELVDDTTWRITLHEGISFTSGRTLDAEAVKECLEDLIAVHDLSLIHS